MYFLRDTFVPILACQEYVPVTSSFRRESKNEIGHAVEPVRHQNPFSAFPQELVRLQEQLCGVPVDVRLPRFALERVASVRNFLSVGTLGLAAIFDGGGSVAPPDLSLLLGKSGPLGDLLQASKLVVDEDGLGGPLGGCPTGLWQGDCVMRCGMFLPQGRVINFHAERPFLALVTHTASQVLLLVGRVLKPITNA